MEHLPKVGAYVLESLTTGMYRDPLDTVREYVQNALDAIRAAEREGLLQPNAGRVEVLADPKTRRFTLRDNGVGIASSQVRSRLLNVGMSGKQLGASAGFRGIGRLHGIAYCRRLVFRTSAKGERTVATLTIDCEGLRRALVPAKREVEELSTILARHADWREDTASSAEHYFEVTMECVLDGAAAVLDFQQLETYLSQVAPVAFDPQRFPYAQKIYDWISRHGLTMPQCVIFVESGTWKKQVFKPYRTHYKANAQDVDVRDICFIPETPSADSAFWCWYGRADLVGSIEDDQVACLRLRHHNIALNGADGMSDLFAAVAKSNRRFNGYFIGEVHVTSPEAIPNARRDAFEDQGAWPKVREDLMPLVESLCKEVRRQSDERNLPIAKVLAGAQRTMDRATERIQAGLASSAERDDLQAKLARERERIARNAVATADAAKAEQLTAMDSALSSLETRLREGNHFAGRRLSSHLDRKERKVVEKVLEAVRDTLAKHDCPRREECIEKLQAAILNAFRIGGKKESDE